MNKTKLEIIKINEDVITTSYICDNVTGISPYSYRGKGKKLTLGVEGEKAKTVDAQCTVNGIDAGDADGLGVFKENYHYHVITGGTDPVNGQTYQNFWTCDNPAHYKDFQS